MIDHIFALIDPAGPEIAQMEQLGLVETYRRVHPGQGTRNICYCFDNLFLELLWVDDTAAAMSPTIRRTGLYDRSLWRSSDVCRFGIAWRAPSSETGLAIPTWPYAPPYLPEGMAIAVARDGDDPRQPMMFQSPGSAPPSDWPFDRRGQLQRGNGLGAVQEITLTVPTWAPPSDALSMIAASCQPRIALPRESTYSLDLRIEGLEGRADLLLSIPG